MKKNLCVSIILWLTALAAVLSACMAAGARSRRTPQDSAAGSGEPTGSQPPAGTPSPVVVMPPITNEPSVSVSPPEETTTPAPEPERPLPILPGSTAAGWDASRADGFPADTSCTPEQFFTKWLTVEGLSRSDLDARGCRQLVLTAAQADGVTTLTTCYEKGADGVWYHMGSLLEMPGWVGAKGIAHDRRRYTDTSPAGLWGLGTAFGNGEKPAGLLLPWRDVTPRSDWVCDAGSPYFNTWQERSNSAAADCWDHGDAEHLANYPNQYAYACVIGYNLPPDPVPERGCAIFLHCAKGPTEGCVGLPAPELLRTLLWLDPAKHPYILISGTEPGH